MILKPESLVTLVNIQTNIPTIKNMFILTVTVSLLLLLIFFFPFAFEKSENLMDSFTFNSEETALFM